MGGWEFTAGPQATGRGLLTVAERWSGSAEHMWLVSKELDDICIGSRSPTGSLDLKDAACVARLVPASVTDQVELTVSRSLASASTGCGASRAL